MYKYNLNGRDFGMLNYSSCLFNTATEIKISVKNYLLLYYLGSILSAYT